MSEDSKSDKGSKQIPAETIEQIKRQILFGSGYGRPPKEHQFKKGESGNPKGRPKTVTPVPSTELDTLILEEANRQLRVQENGAISHVSMRHAVLRALGQSAVKGNGYAAKVYLQHLGRAEAKRQAAVDEDIRYWTDYFRRVRETNQTLQEQGKPPLDLLPLEEDMVIDPKRGVRFIGPMSKEEVAMVENTCAQRDLFLIQHGWEFRNYRDERHKTAALLAAQELDRLVPKRYRLPPGSWERKIMRWEGTSKRELRKLLFQGWKALGHRWRPDDLPSSVAAFSKCMQQMWDIAGEVLGEESGAR
jgi:hypothetical protein